MDIITYLLALKKSKLYTDQKFSTATRGSAYKGSVNSLYDLNQISEKEAGDIYKVNNTGFKYIWTSTEWEPLDELLKFLDTEFKVNEDFDYISLTGNLPYLTEAPTADNDSNHMKFVILQQEPENKYDGYLYIILTNEENK